MDPFMMIFTSGTSEIQSVPVSHLIHVRRARLTERFGLTRTGHLRIHAVSPQRGAAGWAPAVVSGAAIALARRFRRPASSTRPPIPRHLYELRRQAARLYPAFHPRMRRDDADNPLRVAFGTRPRQDIEEFHAASESRVGRDAGFG